MNVINSIPSGKSLLISLGFSAGMFLYSYHEDKRPPVKTWAERVARVDNAQAGTYASSRINNEYKDAQIVTKEKNQYGLYETAEKFFGRLGLPAPAIYLTRKERVNAIAFLGADRQGKEYAAIILGAGLMEFLSEERYKTALIAHENQHFEQDMALYSASYYAAAVFLMSLAVSSALYPRSKDGKIARALTAATIAMAGAGAMLMPMRAMEYEADLVAARQTSAEDMAKMLKLQAEYENSSALDEFLASFWTHPPYYSRIKHVLSDGRER